MTRQKETIIQYLLEGKSVNWIADNLPCSKGTVSYHRAKVMPEEHRKSIEIATPKPKIPKAFANICPCGIPCKYTYCSVTCTMNTRNIKHCPKCNKDLEPSFFYPNNTQPLGLQSYCRACTLVHVKQFYDNDPETKKKKQKIWDRARIIRGRQRVIDYLLTHPCIDCGQENILTLQFDHRIPLCSRDLRRILTQKFISQKKFDKELAKCVVRCANCHVIRHREENKDYRYQYLIQQGPLV